jgi:predicted metal-dependent HD superfamily phosphohydrolase
VLHAAYAERQRHYHTAKHIRECLSLFDMVAELADHPDEVELAIWLHDVVYDPGRTDNEDRSADMATAWLDECRVDETCIRRVGNLIASTRHAASPGTADEALLQDIDLGIFGSTPERYAEYEAGIRREYYRVPSFLFRRRRAEILESFLGRATIYRTPWFRERLEAVARKNLARSVADLRGLNG